MNDGNPSPGTSSSAADPHLEEWIAKAAANPLHLPAMWRALKHAQAHILVPCAPEAKGEFELGEGDALSVVALEEAGETYAPLYTRLEQAEETAASLGESYGVASADGAALFEMLADTGHPVVINPSATPRLKIDPEIVHELATTGHVSRQRFEPAIRPTELLPVAARDVPHDYLLALRGYCAARRRVVAGLYLFHPLQPDAVEPRFGEYRFMLRLHQRDDAVVREFSELASRSVPGGKTVNTLAATDTQPELLAYLDTVRPIWPV